MSSENRIEIPLLSQLMPGGIRPGTALAVEFDPDSQWLALATSIATKTVLNGGFVLYCAMARPVEEALRDLSVLGIDVPKSFREGMLHVDDFYSATLSGGRLLSNVPHEPYEYGIRHSLSVADFSIAQAKAQKDLSEGRPEPLKSVRPGRDFGAKPGSLLIMDSLSVMLRFNEERPFLEWLETREHRAVRRDLRINFEAFVRGLHSESFYKRVEASCDGVIDVRTQEENGVLKNVLRLRVLKGQPHDTRWHEIEIKPNGEAALIS